MSCCGEETKTYKGRLSGKQLVKAQYWLPMDQTNPPAGGWGLTISSSRFEGFPDDHVDALVHAEWDEVEAQQLILDAYRSRSGVNTYSDKPYVVELTSKLPMSVVGPLLWGWLALQVHSFGDVRFQDMIHHVLDALNPQYCPQTGCKECYDHFQKIVSGMEFKDYPHTKEEAANWLVSTHNEVNKKLGKREWTLPEAKDFWKWEF